uniref:Cell division coordinator CpoB n=1 Tax=Candidatus Kentrum sp. LPFa TaxID=2126335 RepID=A0A450W554_9GAMM|nr:MAG: tol-pal system protein YbgF [Candidatus Kentron sp. LPFa]
MRILSTCLTAVLLCVLSPYSDSAESMDSDTIEERLDHVERVIGSRALMDLLKRVDDLQREIQELRGQVEVQAHALSRIKQSQRNYYLDLDKRLQQVGVAATEAGATTPAASRLPGVRISPAVEPDAASVREKPLQGLKKTAPSGIESSSDREQAAYQKAFDLLKKKHYAEAITSLKAFLKRYSGGQYAENAQYWLGETYYIMRQFKPSLNVFQRLLREYPSSSKINDALLKIGYAQDELGQKAEAERTLGNLIKQSPDSTQAHLARKRLQKILGKTP